MADTSASPWLTIVGIGEDAADGLSAASRKALEQAELVMGAARHLALLSGLSAPSRQWPVPFSDGLPLLMAERGRKVVALVSGDPFWFGAGSSLTRDLDPGEWIAHPAPSTFGLAAARLGWALQDCACLGLHAAPVQRLRPHLATGRRLLVLVRDGGAVAKLAGYLVERGFGASTLHVLEALGGPRERVRSVVAQAQHFDDIQHPVAVGIAVAGAGCALPVSSGLPDDLFDHDGQITKSPLRALTLSALAPRPGEHLWDIGAGSGSVSIEWLLAHPANTACAVEADSMRAERAKANALALGVDRLELVIGRAPQVLPQGPSPDAVFVGGGLSDTLLEILWQRLPTGTRLVANAVTLESEALLAHWHGERGGSLLRIELADAAPLGSRRGWRSRYPVVQWSVAL
ncbi:bifunctional cobalt-precorrin-7 (C(5))-methyltransferase/cobalt-precorrin-6B (C(15))-methyltransferase [Novosphingobium resinovorum]|uniref:bifunctional cobalt-precorrin-7 (C(5))-methyltransferase/cobalt-precorrin-6B (C(15))-methyltransferase n=1 Tax=Novosphingobium resinovorum TaxID=158500 RepID=UPI000565D4F9|nr:bifunctional cobalt-precorrin-7 (C(5))-methyltransferase/cobalt-precorrin-6B (C(15))-methyltransferase [Novosphingobium resinovorum]